jgi:hypothetical protein
VTGAPARAADAAFLLIARRVGVEAAMLVARLRLGRPGGIWLSVSGRISSWW